MYLCVTFRFAKRNELKRKQPGRKTAAKQKAAAKGGKKEKPLPPVKLPKGFEESEMEVVPILVEVGSTPVFVASLLQALTICLSVVQPCFSSMLTPNEAIKRNGVKRKHARHQAFGIGGVRGTAARE